MPIDRRVTLALALPLGLALGACENGMTAGVESASHFGEANRQTLAAQVIDPDPQYEYLDPETSGEHAAQAVERYRRDAVKKPERISASAGTGGSGGR